MAPSDLTALEAAEIIAPHNHPDRLSAQELDLLTGHLTDPELEEVVFRLGLECLTRQLPPVLQKLLRIAQRVEAERPPGYEEDADELIHPEDAINDLIRGVDAAHIGGTCIFSCVSLLSDPLCRETEYPTSLFA